MRINGYIGRNLILDQKTGFHNPDPLIPVVIVDERGIPFYETTHLERRPARFNLPPGSYRVLSGKFYKMPAPVDYPLLPIMPPMRRMRKNPERFNIVFCDNPRHKCTVDWDDETIYFDHELEAMPLPNLIYILFHEYGHRYYGCNCTKPLTCPKCREAELQCDRYAQNRMLERGYNPSQIGEAILGTLSSKQRERKTAVVNSLYEVSDVASRPECQNYFHSDARIDCCEGCGGTCGGTCNAGPPFMESATDSLEYTDTPNPDWSCEDWVVWHKDLLRAYQDGRLGKLDYERALEETNRVFAYHWKESAGFSKKFWGYCGYQSGFYNYFRDIGYTDHISFLAGLFSGVGEAISEAAGGTADIVKETAGGAAGSVRSLGKILPFLLLALAVVLVVAFVRKT
jgi:hypothetical protein